MVRYMKQNNTATVTQSTEQDNFQAFNQYINSELSKYNKADTIPESKVKEMTKEVDELLGTNIPSYYTEGKSALHKLTPQLVRQCIEAEGKKVETGFWSKIKEWVQKHFGKEAQTDIKRTLIEPCARQFRQSKLPPKLTPKEKEMQLKELSEKYTPPPRDPKKKRSIMRSQSKNSLQKLQKKHI